MKQITMIAVSAFLAMLSTAYSWGQTSETINYIFSDKDWKATVNNSAANWTDYTSGDSFESADPARGIAKSKATINGTSPDVISNVSSVTVVASANMAGPTLTIYKVVDNTETSIYSASMTKNNNKEYTVDLTGNNVFSGKIKVVLASSSSYKSVWIKNVSVTHSTGGSSNTPSFTASAVNIAYSAMGGSIAYTLNNGVDGGSVSTTVKTGDWLTLGQDTTSPISFTCSANSSTSSRTATVTLTYTYNTNQTVTKDVVITQAGAPQPSISADNVNIAYNATNGSIGYTLTNGNGNVSATVTSGDWLTLGTITESSVPFTCSANTATTARSAQVTLSYTGAENKVVTVTQAKRPNYISEITALNTNYSVIGAVVAINSRGFVIGDGTGYVYYYQGSDAGKSVGNLVSISGSTGTYGQILQFTNSAKISTANSSNYDNTPAIAILDASAIADYDNDQVYKLSNYVQFEGALAATTSGNTTYYDITVGTGNSAQTARISYPTSAQITSLSALVNKTVRVKGYFSGWSSNSTYFTVMMESVEEVTTPSISVNPSSASAFSYVTGNGPSEEQMFEVTGSHLTSADITASVSSDYEITDNTDYSSSVTIGSGDAISVRLKAGLTKGTHNGTLTLSTQGAQNVTVNLSGTVTGQTYAISQYRLPATAHGTITFAPTSPVEDGTEVTLTAEPAEGYEFTANSWVFYKEGGQDYVVDNTITASNGKITMPAYDLYVDATFTAKPTYAVTCVANPAAGGTIDAQPSSAYEGQSVALTINPAEGYTLSSVVITKTSDGSATDITVTNNAFTMPGYAVTATATFLSNTFEGSFVKHSGSLTEGDYILVYNDQAMNNTVSNSKFGNTSVKDDISENTITDPLRSIVWHIEPSTTSGYWTIYNAKVNKYVCGTGSSTNVSLVDSPVNNDAAIWKVSGTYDFQCKANEGQSTARYLRNNSGSYGNYAAQNGGALTLYKLFIAPDPSAPVWSSLPTSNEATVGEEFEVNLLEYVSGFPVPEITIKTTTADPLLYELADGGLRFTPNVAGSFTFEFTATNSEGYADSGTLTITATAAEVSTPVLNVDEANVTSNSALVFWTACTDATVYTIEKSESLIDESFEGNAVPTDWTANSISFSDGGSDGTYCATFNSGSDYIITPPVTNPGTISFNYKRSSNTTAWSLDVLYATSANASSWESIGTVNNATTSWQTFSKTLNVTGTIYIKLKDSRSDSGNHARYVDLIQVTGATTSTEVSGTSYTFKGLSSETTYAARVQVKGAETWSNMVSFTTDATTPTTTTLSISAGAKYEGRYWTTFYDGKNGYKLPAGAQAFKLDENKLVLLGDNGVVIPKETAVVIISDKASLTLTQTNATVTVGENDLVGSSEDVTVTNGKVDGKIPHVLSIKGSAIGFYKFSGTTIPARKAYVLVSE